MTRRHPTVSLTDIQGIPPRTIFLFLFLRLGVYSQEADVQRNSIAGDPFVSCAADAIYVKFKTNSTFEGQVNVKYTPNKYCYQVLVTNNQIEVLIPHEECAVSRRRSLQPAGVYLDLSLSVSFHPEFTTADDRLFHFHCFHIPKTKGAGLEIGSPTEPPQEVTPGPQCSYSILQSPGGRQAGTVALGQTIYHQWTCEQTKDTCLFVRNCVLVAADSRHSLIGADGCSKDTKLLPQLEYNNASFISQSVPVFGVSSTSLVFFECQLMLLPSIGHCQTPSCHSTNRTRRDLEDSDSVMEVRSQRIEISELDHFVPTPSVATPSASCSEAKIADRVTSSLCVSLSAFAITIALIVSMAIFVVFLASLALLQRYRYYNVARNNT